MTTANKITLARICIIPFFIYFASQPMFVSNPDTLRGEFPLSACVALALFCIASFTDFLDGYVARKYNQVTDFGKFVDPLADKLLVSSALILLAEQGALAGWMVCVILAREFIITGLRTVAANKGRVLAATWTGKVKTCVQLGGIILIYLFHILLGLAGSGALDGSANGTFFSFAIVSTPGSFGFPQLAGLVMTLVTVYSGYDYLRRNWDLIRDGAVKHE